MKIGIAGPVDLQLLDLHDNHKLPQGYNIPLLSFMVNYFVKRGIKPIIYSSSKGLKKPVIIEDHNMILCFARQDVQSGRKFFRQEIKDLSYLINKTNPDIVHANWTYEFALGAIQSGKPHIITVHDVALQILRYQMDPYRFVRYLMNRKTMNKGQYFTANSEYTYNTLPEKVKKRTKIIYNYIPEHLLNFKTSQNKRKQIIAVNSGMSKNKNVETAIEAFKIFRKLNKDYELILVGLGMEINGPAYRFAQLRQGTDGVIFAGQQPYDQVMKLMSESEIFLHTSLEESFGMVILEAMVLKTAVIGGSKSGNVPYLLGHGERGILANVRNANDVAEKILNLVGRKELQDSLIQKAYDFAIHNFEQNIIMEQFIDYYYKVLGQKNSIYLNLQG
jgi:glycosyltransferase involved in cell wall biosynthesis